MFLVMVPMLMSVGWSKSLFHAMSTVTVLVLKYMHLNSLNIMVSIYLMLSKVK